MAVNANDFSAAFFHISSLKNANTNNNTAASKQPNLFWFWDLLIYLFVHSVLIAFLSLKNIFYNHHVIKVRVVAFILLTVFIILAKKSYH